MDNMEFNKIFAAILVAGIIAASSGFFAKKIVHPHDLKDDAVPIEGVEIVAGAAPKIQLPEPAIHLIAAADVERGQKVSKACAACHSFTKGGANGIGPNLWNVVAKKKQSVSGYSYSGVLNAQGQDYWTYQALNHYLWKPKAYAKGTKMNYIGLKKPEDRAAIIAWLRTLSDSPQALPTDAQIASEKAAFAPPEIEPEQNEDSESQDEEGKSEEDTQKDAAIEDTKQVTD